MFPTVVVIGFVIVCAVIIVGAVAGLAYLFAELWDEKKEALPGWDDTTELNLWRAEDDRERLRCPDCRGTRCWDWRRSRRFCGDTTNPHSGNLLGAHDRFAVQAAVPGWWPLPKTLAARRNPDLWRKVADHCQVALTRPRVVALP